MRRILSVPTLVIATSLATTGYAEVVELKSADGSVELQGAFVEFADGDYVIDTPLGELRVSSERVDCFGSTCPFFDIDTPDLQISVADDFENDLILSLIDAFAQNTGAAVTRFDLPRKEALYLQVDVDNWAKLRVEIVRSSGSGGMPIGKEGADLAITSDLTEITGYSQRVVANMPVVPVRQSGDMTAPLSVSGLLYNLKAQTEVWRVYSGFEAHSLMNRETVTDGNHDEEVAEAARATTGFNFLPIPANMATGSLPLVNSCGEPARIDRHAVKTGQYPLLKTYFVRHRDDLASREAADFISFLFSKVASQVLSDHGLVDPWPELVQAEPGSHATRFYNGSSSDLLDQMLDLRASHQRLSSTFFFPSGSSEIDHIDQEQLIRLAEYLAELPDGTQVVFAGFTDDVGRSGRNQRLSLERASRLADAVQLVGRGDVESVSISTVGFGEISPTTCNADASGRNLNRRVEIWINSYYLENAQAFLVE